MTDQLNGKESSHVHELEINRGYLCCNGLNCSYKTPAPADQQPADNKESSK